MLKKRKDSRGAITVEATISLTTFLFLFMMLYCIITLCRAQAIIGSALNSTAKEISQYTYLYSITGIHESLQEVTDASGTVKDVDDLTENINTALNAMQKFNQDGQTAVNTGWDSTADVANDWLNIKNDIKDVQSASSDVIDSVENLAKDPKSLLIGLAKIAAGDGLSLAKSKLITPPICRALIQKHLVSSSEGEVEGFLHSLRVIPGSSSGGTSYLKGLDFSNSSLFATSDYDIILRVEYELQIIPYLPIDLKVKICQSASTRGWANGDGRHIEKNGSVAVVRPTVDTSESTPPAATTSPTNSPSVTTSPTTSPGATTTPVPTVTPGGGGGGVVVPTPTTNPQDTVAKKNASDKYGDKIVDAIAKSYDTTGWGEDDWKYYVTLAIKDDEKVFDDPLDQKGFDEFLTRSKGVFPSEAVALEAFQKLVNGQFEEYVSYFDFSPKNGKGYLWSNDEGKKDAIKYAEAHGGQIMEMTEGGRVLDNWNWLQDKFPNWKASDTQKEGSFQQDLWIAASERYADGLSGTVIYFNETSEGEVYRNYELKKIKQLYDAGIVTELVYNNQDYYKEHYLDKGKTPLD